MAKESRKDKRVARHQRIRKNLSGTPERPRLCVFRSNKNISVQIIDDVNGVTLASASTIDKELKSEIYEYMKEHSISELLEIVNVCVQAIESEQDDNKGA